MAKSSFAPRRIRVAAKSLWQVGHHSAFKQGEYQNEKTN
jgi:hypothetical protein